MKSLKKVSTEKKLQRRKQIAPYSLAFQFEDYI